MGALTSLPSHEKGFSLKDAREKQAFIPHVNCVLRGCQY